MRTRGDYGAASAAIRGYNRRMTFALTVLAFVAVLAGAAVAVHSVNKAHETARAILASNRWLPIEGKQAPQRASDAGPRVTQADGQRAYEATDATPPAVY